MPMFAMVQNGGPWCATGSKAHWISSLVSLAMANRRVIRGDLLAWVKEKIEADRGECDEVRFASAISTWWAPFEPSYAVHISSSPEGGVDRSDRDSPEGSHSGCGKIGRYYRLVHHYNHVIETLSGRS